MCRTLSGAPAALASLLLAGFALRGLRSRHLWQRVCAACTPRRCPAGP